MFRWLFKIVCTLAVLLLIGAGLLVTIPSDRIAQLASDQVEAATGRTLTVTGEIVPTVWPHVGVRAEGVALSGPDWSDAGPTLEARSLVLGLDPLKLIRGEVVTAALEVTGATVVLERRADGTGSWEMAGAAPDTADGASDMPPLSIPSAVLRDSTLRWIDAAGPDLTLTAMDLVVAAPALDGPVTVGASALLDGAPAKLDARVDGLTAFLGGALTGVDAELVSVGTRLMIDGRADLDPLSFAGQIDVESTDGFAVLGKLGLERPDLPEGLGAGRAALAADVTMAPEGTLHLREMVLALDGNRLTGGMDVDPTRADRPHVAATLAAEELDLTMLAADGAAPAPAPETDGWSTERIDVSGLFAVDGQVSLAAGRVALPDLVLDEVRTDVTLDRGRAVAALKPVRVHGGTVTGEVVVNGRGGLSARANLDLRDMDLGGLAEEYAGFDRLVAAGGMTVSLLGVGDDVAALMRSLDGRVAVTLGQGEIEGLDVAGMIRNLDPSYVGEGRKTVFDGLSAVFAVADGVGRSEDFALASRHVDVAGTGAVDLGRRTLDWRMLPTLKAGDRSLEVPILIRGAWDDPSIRPDLELLARRELAAERERLEARAKAEIEEKLAAAEADLQDRLADELDVEPVELSSREQVEDAIKQRVENKLMEALLGN